MLTRARTLYTERAQLSRAYRARERASVTGYSGSGDGLSIRRSAQALWRRVAMFPMHGAERYT